MYGRTDEETNSEITLALTCDGVVGGGQSGQCVDVPQEDRSVKSGRRNLLTVPSVGQRLHVILEREREMFYLTTHSTHFIYGYMASDIWLRTILIVR